MVGHDSLVRGLGATGASGPPLILQRTDADFIGTTLELLRTPDPFQAVQASQADTRDKDQRLRLYQPVHRTFNVVLVDAYCDRPGVPRIDPAKIESAGFVVRRVFRKRAKGAQPADPFPQGWLSVGKTLRGWRKLEDPDRDPDPLRRPVATGGHPAIAAQALSKARLVDGAEQVTPLFVAPPDVCAAAGRTLLYGVVPTASAEMSESPAPAISPDDYDLAGPDGDTSLAKALPQFIRKLNAPLSFGSFAGQTFSGKSAAAFSFVDSSGTNTAIKDKTEKKLFTDFLNFVRFLRISLDAFGSSPDATELRQLLSEIVVPRTQDEADAGTGQPADQLLSAVATALVAQVPGAPETFTMPLQWPKVSEDLATRLYTRVKTSLAAGLSAAQPGIPRFEDATARYVVRAFVRIKRDDGCPPELVWTEPSEEFSIVPWFENGKLPPVQIQLPDITSANVKQLKPNVAFRLPKKLFNFLNDLDPKALLDGEASEGSSLGLDWICGFNISIIFMLAFIVMFIFLILLNIVFWWLPFIKICFPIPSFSSREDS